MKKSFSPVGWNSLTLTQMYKTKKQKQNKKIVINSKILATLTKDIERIYNIRH